MQPRTVRHPKSYPATAVGPAHLRQRILDASRELLEIGGVAALSLREVARRVGVTHQAPYHHFADREAIVAELVCQGFHELAERMAAANELAESAGKRTALITSHEAYVGFAIKQPGVFRIMFRPELCDMTRFPEARAAGMHAGAQLERLIRLVHGGADTFTLASLYWAQVHGLACLMVDGPLGKQLRTRKAQHEHLLAVSQRFADAVLGS